MTNTSTNTNTRVTRISIPTNKNTHLYILTFNIIPVVKIIPNINTNIDIWLNTNSRVLRVSILIVVATVKLIIIL